MSATESNPILALAAHAHALSVDDLDANTLAAAQMIITDTLAVGLAGCNASYADALRGIVNEWGVGGPCRVLGKGASLPAASAAFMNAYQIHGQEFDCVHEAAVVHPMAAIMAATLAEIERGTPEGNDATGVSGAEFVATLTAAVDVAIAVGLSAKAGLRFFRPATAGAFGAAAAVSRLRGFSLDTTVQTFGHLYSQLCGTMQAHTEGVAVLPMQIGFNARNAIIAADLANAGISAPVDVIDGPFGYLELFEPGGSMVGPLRELDQVRRIGQLAYKPFPTGRATHGGLDGLLSLCREHDIAASRVKAATLTGPPLIHRLVARPIHAGLPANYARLCMQYTGAVAILRGSIGLFDFDHASLADSEIHALAAKISVIDDGTPDPNALSPQTVEIQLADGRKLQRELTQIYGSPQQPMNEQQHREKVSHCCEFAGFGTHADAIFDQGTQLVQLPDIGPWLAHAYAS